MSNQYLEITPSGPLSGTVSLSGAKNAVLVVMASLILTSGKSILKNVPVSDDVYQFIKLLQGLGASVSFDEAKNILIIDTSTIDKFAVDEVIMSKMRASILAMGPLLSRFGRAEMALPGGCRLGARPVDFHLKAFKKMGAKVEIGEKNFIVSARALEAKKFVLEYPSVGATENIIMAAVLTLGITKIVNAALEPEVLDLIDVLKKMGAKISVEAPATIIVEGVCELKPVEYEIMPDRLEAGSLLLAAAITGGTISLPQAQPDMLDVFLHKLQEMGHEIIIGNDGVGITLMATSNPKAVSFRTAPYPGFPTDLQAPMMVAQALAEGVSVIQETVFENRLIHVRELEKMGAEISVNGCYATVKGVEGLYGANVIASDIRAGCALVLAGLVAEGKTVLSGVHHLKRGYQGFQDKLKRLGADIELLDLVEPLSEPRVLRVGRASDQVG